MLIFSYLYDDKVLVLKCSLYLSNTNTEIWSKEKSMGPYVAKMFFLQVDKIFRQAILVSGIKILKLILCFLILIL